MVPGFVRSSSFPSFAHSTHVSPLGNCTPRLPASNFLVRKEGKNKGRWFYTCQLPRDDGGCGFFLWNEDAIHREGKVVLANSTSETSPEVGRTPGKRHTFGNDRTPKAENVEDKSESEDDGEFGSWPPSPVTQQIAGESTNNIPFSPETPRKASKMAPFTTPNSKRKRSYDNETIDRSEFQVGSDALPTPITGGGTGGKRVISLSEYGNDDSDIFSTPLSLRSPSHNNSMGIRSPRSTPPPLAGHFRQTSPTPRGPRQEVPVISNPYDITTEVLDLLAEESVLLDGETGAKLRNLLSRHAMRVSGIAKGRDITRVALKSKDVRIGELGLRIGQLEAEREVDKRIISGLRSEKERGRQEGEGEDKGKPRGRGAVRR